MGMNIHFYTDLSNIRRYEAEGKCFAWLKSFGPDSIEPHIHVDFDFATHDLKQQAPGVYLVSRKGDAE